MKDFKQAVTDLKEAADSAQRQSSTIRDSMGTVRGVATQVADLGVLISSVQEALANTQNTLLENRSDTAENGQADTPRSRIKGIWRGLQELVERIASRPSIHGHTRARYARIDRRADISNSSAHSSMTVTLRAARTTGEPHTIFGRALSGARPNQRRPILSEWPDLPVRSTTRMLQSTVPRWLLLIPRSPPGVLMTPRNVEAETPKSHARAALAQTPRASASDELPRRSDENEQEQRHTP